MNKEFLLYFERFCPCMSPKMSKCFRNTRREGKKPKCYILNILNRYKVTIVSWWQNAPNKANQSKLFFLKHLARPCVLGTVGHNDIETFF